MKDTAIAAVVEPVVVGCGLEVDRIEIASAGKRSILRIFLDGDGPDGRGPSLDEIADTTRELSRALDESSATGPAPYTLEVSSRGATRPLTEPKHYRRNTGRLVALTLAGSRVEGRIADIDDEAVTIDVDGATQRVPLADVRKAVIQVELRKDAGTDPDDATDEQE